MAACFLSNCRPQLTLEELLPASTPPQALDLLKQLLVFNPEKWLTAEEALEHPYVQRFHCAAKEPALDHSVTLPLADDVQLSVAEYCNRVYEVMPCPSTEQIQGAFSHNLGRTLNGQRAERWHVLFFKMKEKGESRNLLLT
ncbi:mitogen-activated protein kinase 15-like [Candoia aspera]|uniref:mitogen-activated protein kinase 15-like n=1 Tax=Candoia aspera TaxID=51853 RepID=UPI002FD7B4A7